MDWMLVFPHHSNVESLNPVDLWGVISSWGEALMNGISALRKETPEIFLTLILPWVMVRRRQLPMNQKLGLTKPWIFWCLDLRLPSISNCAKKNVFCLSSWSMIFYYSSLNWWRQGFVQLLGNWADIRGCLYFREHKNFRVQNTKKREKKRKERLK